MELIKKNIVNLLLLFLFISQLNFIYSDPDINISDSRGPWSDEGLNTCQIRSYSQNNELLLDSSDNLVKTPLFGLILYMPFKAFGTSQPVGRLSVLIISILSILLISRINNYFKKLAFLLIPVVFFQYHIYHFTHFSMSEMPSTLSIFLGVTFLYLGISANNNKNSNLFVSALCFSISYFLKIQFLYVAMIAPVFLLLILLLSKFTEIQSFKSLKKTFKLFFFYLILFGIIYILCWYFPNKELLEYVMDNQTTGRFIDLSSLNFKGVILDFLHTFYDKTIAVTELRAFFLTFCLATLIGILLLLKKSINKNFKILFLISLSWFIIETHKFSMLYLPNRYLVSMYFSMGLIICITILECYQLLISKQKNKAFLFIPLSISLVLIISINTFFYFNSINRRTYQISKISQELKKYDFQGRPIMGAWGPAISWETKTNSYPIWDNYFNYRQIISKYNPKLIVLETNDTIIYKNLEKEKVNQLTDSISRKKIGNWNLNFYWLK